MPVDGFFGRSAGSLVRGEAVGAEPVNFLDVIPLSYIWPLRSRGSERGRSVKPVFRRVSRRHALRVMKGGS
jgi:hypothetical protein